MADCLPLNSPPWFSSLPQNPAKREFIVVKIYGASVSKSSKSLDYFIDIFFTSRYTNSSNSHSYRNRHQTRPRPVLKTPLFLKQLFGIQKQIIVSPNAYQPSKPYSDKNPDTPSSNENGEPELERNSPEQAKKPNCISSLDDRFSRIKN
jgi:hypothetical protein